MSRFPDGDSKHTPIYEMPTSTVVRAAKGAAEQGRSLLAWAGRQSVAGGCPGEPHRSRVPVLGQDSPAEIGIHLVEPQALIFSQTN